MADVIRRQKANHSDLNYSSKPAPIEYESIHKMGINEHGEQETTKAQKYEIALTKRDAIYEKRRKEMLAFNFGFSKSLNGYETYTVYRADMRSQHDVYRKPAHSDIWSHNSLWDSSKDTIPIKGHKSNQIRFKANTWLKKVSFFELKAAIREFRNNGEKWADSWFFLPDMQTVKNRPIKTACKKLIMNGLLDNDYYYLQVSCYAFKRQYYVSHEIKLFGLEPDYKPKAIKQGEPMEPKKADVFDKCHISMRAMYKPAHSDYDNTAYKAHLVTHLRESEIIDKSSPNFNISRFMLIQAMEQAKPAQKKAVPKANFNLWRAAKSDEIFMEQFRYRVID